MPEPYTDEGTETRESYFCSPQNRCSRCYNAKAAGAGRLTLQIRRCPGDGTFRAADSDTKTSHDESKSSSASSSELPQATPSHETDDDPRLVANLAQMSLTDSHAKRVDVGEKRKAAVEPESQAKHQKRQFDLQIELNSLRVKDYLQNKPQKIFQDANMGNVPVLCWRFPEALYAGPACASFVAGCNVSTEAEGQGLMPCFDDVQTPECAVFPWPEEMDCEKP